LPPAAHFSPGIGFTYFGRGVDVSFGFGLGYDAFCFVPVNRFHYREPWRYHAPHQDVVRIFPHSRPENHYEYRRDRREFVNAGVSGVAHGAAAAVVHQTAADSRGGVRERVEQRGNQTVVYAPHAPAPGTGARVASRPSNFSGIANTAASPQSANPRRSYTAPATGQEATRGQSRSSQLLGKRNCYFWNSGVAIGAHATTSDARATGRGLSADGLGCDAPIDAIPGRYSKQYRLYAAGS
jgi:hypothetical protein